MNKSYIVTFTLKNVMRVFQETVEATDTQAAAEAVKTMVKQAGQKLNQVVSIIQK